MDFELSGQIVDVVGGTIAPGTIRVCAGKIADITDTPSSSSNFILPGLIDAHVHIESSMLVPSEFARLAVLHGTVATVSDPHEIANVLGLAGIEFMLENGAAVPFKFFFGAPSCVPATSFETAGAKLGPEEVATILARPDILYLAEMMNFPGVLHSDKEVMQKIECAKRHGKPIDGHAPGLGGLEAAQYAAAGISTDHECVSLEEALQKIALGMKIIIREGSAAKNFEALYSLLRSHPEQVMLCSDDKHPNDLVVGHINKLLARAVSRGIDRFSAIRAATLNPVRHYRLSVGLLQVGDPADFIVVKDLEKFEVISTYVDGFCVARDGISAIEKVKVSPSNNFCCAPVKQESLTIKAASAKMRVIEALPGQIVTNELIVATPMRGELAVSDTANDILKVVVLNRYQAATPAIAFIKNIGLKRGAIASSVAHDSHNIIAVGVTDEDIAGAINGIIAERGGISVFSDGTADMLALPIAGIMSASDGNEVAEKYEQLDRLAKNLGATLDAPFMTLSFLALLVIPKLKLSDRGLFDGERFKFTPLFLEAC